MQDRLPIERDEIPSHAILRRWPHLSVLSTEMPDRDDTVPIGLIIGANCSKALEPHEVIPSVIDGPFAVRTALGWCVSGPSHLIGGQTVRTTNTNKLFCNRTTVEETKLKDMLLTMCESDFTENECQKHLLIDDKSHKLTRSIEECKMSQEDRKFLEVMEANVKLVNGHYQLPLPFRDNNVIVPNNRTQVVQRAFGVKKKLCRDGKFKTDYIAFMSDIIDKGYAKKIPEERSRRAIEDGNCWYIPHHEVYQTKSEYCLIVAVSMQDFVSIRNCYKVQT